MKAGLSFIFFLLILPLCGCSRKPDNPDAVRKRAADATAEIKAGAANATSEIQKGAANATAEISRDTKAVAEGMREGWTRDQALDINAASKKQLQSLPGVTPKLAENIVSHRPYAKTSELVDKHIMSKPEYERVAHRLTVKP